MKKVVRKSLIIIMILVTLLALGTTGYFYKKYNDIKKDPNKVSNDEIKSITSVIGKYIELPTDETPTLATVTDKEKLKDQDFFKNAENNDKILIYTSTRKAILYRPSTGKVIEFAPLLIGEDTQSSN